MLSWIDDAASSAGTQTTFGFGGASLGNIYEPVGEEEAERTIAAAWDLGIRHFDTAPIYGLGRSEHRLGRALRDRPRDEYLLSTKVGRLIRRNRTVDGRVFAMPSPSDKAESGFADPLPFAVEVDYGYDAALRSIEDSLQRLGIAYLDVVYVHDLEPPHLHDQWDSQFRLAIDGSFKALAELQEQGVIHAWELSGNVATPLVRALRESNPSIAQISGRYSLLDHSALDELFPFHQERGVPIVLGGNFNSDLLAGGSHYDYAPATPEMITRRDQIAAICRRHEVEPRAAALQFEAAHPAVSALIPGCRSAAEVRDNLTAFGTPVPAPLWAELRSAGFIRPDAPTPS